MSRTALGALIAASVLLSLQLGAGSLMSSDDAIYAQMAREMAAHGQWAEQRWLGHVLFEKPPLLFWLLRISGALFGFTDLAMRLPGVLAAIASLIYVALLTRDAVPQAARRTAPALAVGLTVATVAFTMTARRPLTDPLLTLAVLATLWHASRAALTGSLPHAAAGGLATGLGLLAKSVAIGPAALVATVTLAATRRFGALGLAIACGLLTAAPWYAIVSARHGAELWQVQLGYHLADRASSNIVGDADPLYYVLTAWQTEGLVAIALLVGLLAALPRLRQPPRPLTLALVLATAALTMLAVQLAQTRLFHYLMPLAPLAAVATVCALGPWLHRRWVAPGLAGLIAVALAAGPLYPHILAPDYSPRARQLGISLAPMLEEDARLIIWEDYDPALVWYAARPARIWTAHRPFFDIQQSIDMMRRSEAVVFADEDALRELALTPEPVVLVAPLERAANLDLFAQQVATQRRVQVAEAAGHRIVRLERQP